MENEQKLNEQQTSTKPVTSKPKTDQAAENLEKTFQLEHLPRLTWKASDGSERDVWSSSAEDFHAYVQQFGSIENVDVAIWDVFDRLDYVNDLCTFCQEHGFQFPFAVKPVDKSHEVSA